MSADLGDSQRELPTPPRPRQAATSRIAWGLVSEGIDSGANLFLTVWIARSVSASEFGAFGLVYVGLQLAIVLGRAVANQPMLIAFGNSERRFSSGLASQVLGASLAVGLVGSAVFGASAIFSGGSLRAVLLAAALSAPGLLLQDSCVYVFYGRQRPALAAVNNVVWACTQVAFFLFATYALHAHEAWQFLGLWGAAGYVAVAVSLAELRCLPNLLLVRSWITEQRSRITDLTVETAIGQISQQGVVWVLGITINLAGVAAYRAAQVPYGVLRVFIQGLYPMVVAEGVRLYARSPRLFVLMNTAWGAVGILGTAVTTVALLLLPDTIGRDFLGASWQGAVPIILPIAIASAGNFATVAAQTGLRSIDATRTSVLMRGPVAVLQLGGTLIGALASGLTGAAWGSAVGSTVGAVLFAVAFYWTVAARSESTAASNRNIP